MVGEREVGSAWEGAPTADPSVCTEALVSFSWKEGLVGFEVVFSKEVLESGSFGRIGGFSPIVILLLLSLLSTFFSLVEDTKDTRF